VLHIPTIKPLDADKVISCVNNVPVIVTVEEHSIVGGLGGAVAEIMAEANFTFSKKFKRIGIPDVFPDQYGSQASLMGGFRITTDNIVSTIKCLLGSDGRTEQLMEKELIRE
jgi:transketolase